jgi:hypothetical protein
LLTTNKNGYKMKKIAIWLTYDLGVGGDFQGLYSWLDDKKSIECGNNNAYFKYSFSDAITSDDQLLAALKAELEEKVSFKAGNRIYIIRKSIDTGKSTGSFVIGKRKANPWEGFGTKSEATIDEE